MRHELTALLISLCVAGCAEISQRIAAREAEERAALNAQDDQTCRSLGMTPGTAPYLQCREFVSAQRTATEGRERAVAAETAQQMIQNSQPHSPIAR